MSSSRLKFLSILCHCRQVQPASSEDLVPRTWTSGTGFRMCVLLHCGRRHFRQQESRRRREPTCPYLNTAWLFQPLEGKQEKGQVWGQVTKLIWPWPGSPEQLVTSTFLLPSPSLVASVGLDWPSHQKKQCSQRQDQISWGWGKEHEQSKCCVLIGSFSQEKIFALKSKWAKVSKWEVPYSEQVAKNREPDPSFCRDKAKPWLVYSRRQEGQKELGEQERQGAELESHRD